ncbi:MAG TPA: sigma-70 family RNA polymerase sigma factor [Thermodesulfobacteriota bacterium]|nr:sigma-70 family RNA polymerase sigma factor [Thermodesulfobacteriota bacterium]
MGKLTKNFPRNTRPAGPPGPPRPPGTDRKNGSNPEHATPASDTVRVYFNSIKKIPLLTTREEKTLARKISRGDAEARKKMIESNLRLVVNIAKRYINRGFPLQDLIEEGNIGLIKSVERFKANKGCKFSTYATYWIKQSIERAIANQSNIVRLPIHITADLAKLSRANRELMAQLSREPEMTELIDRTGFSGRYLKKLDIIKRKSFSLDSVSPEGGEQSLIEKIEDETFPNPLALLEDSRRNEMVDAWLGMLEDNERKIIKLRFGLDKNGPQTLESIGRTFGVTRERVRQIEVKALDKLKRIIRDRGDIASFDAV